MKKLLTLALVLMLALIPAASLASEMAYTPYTNEAGGYTIEYPATWVALDRAVFNEAAKAIADGEVAINGLDPALVESIMPQVEQLDMVFFQEAATGINYNIGYQEVGMAVDNATLMTIMPQSVQALQNAMPTMQFISEGEELTSGDNSFVALAGMYQLGDNTAFMMQLYASKGTKLYTITFTFPDINAIDAESMDAMTEYIAGSFKAI